MAAFHLRLRCSPLSFYLAIIQLLTLAAIPISSSPLQTLTTNPEFDPQIALLGDAKSVDNASHVQLVSASTSSSGILLQNKPFNFFDSELSKPVSFSTEFSFSISPGNGDGLAFVVLPYSSASGFKPQGSFGISSEKKYLGIEFDTKMDDNVNDVNANHVGIDVNSLVSETVSNLSSTNLVLKNGEKLKSWIDYDSSSKRIEVRLSKIGDKRPYNPILAHYIDLMKMWGDENAFVGIVSSNGDSNQISNVYSWNFRLRKVPLGMHSIPVNPNVFAGGHIETYNEHQRGFCPMKIVAWLVFATGCVALLAFMVFLAWKNVVNREKEFPNEYQVHPVDFKYQKVDVVAEEGGKVVKG